MEELRSEYAELCKDKTRIEEEIQAIVDELTSGPNAAGLRGPLVDQEGFPRADIDVYRVRHQRHNYAVLQTDHQQVMARIELLLPRLIERKAPPKPLVSSSSAPPSVQQAANDSPNRPLEASKRPFAFVQSVEEDSPAAEAGLAKDDQLLVFGSADATNHRELVAIKEIVTRNIGMPIRVLIRRRQTIPQSEHDQWQAHELTLIPKTWKGPGVLGCLLLPLHVE